MSDDANLDDLDRRSGELLARLSKDDVGPPATAGSHLVGRMVMVSSALENLLRATAVHVADLEQFPVERLMPEMGRGGAKVSIRKATAGQLAYGLKYFFLGRPPASIPIRVGPLVDDLLRGDSKILAFIKIRNDSAHLDGDPKRGAAAANDLKKIVVEFRRRAGWK